VSRLELEAITVVLGGAARVRDASLAVAPGEWVTVIGPNGAGKTTLLRAAGALVPFRGRVRIDGRDAAGLSRRELAQRLALVPQLPLTPPAMHVGDYVLLGRTAHLRPLRSERRADHEAVERALERLELLPYAERRLGSLSGGERQRVVLARALAQGSGILLLDEPTSALDLGHQQQVLNLVAGLRAEDGLTVLSAMHDLTLAGQYADRLALLSEGQIVASGSPPEVLTEALLSAHYRVRLRVVHADGVAAVVPLRSAS
jgi:iron complex transport system ATP-binding protein